MDNLESNPEKLRRLSEHAAPEGAAMSSYRCYFVDETDHVAGAHLIECATDGLAQARADELLVHSVHPAMEVWDGARFVYVAKHHRGRVPANWPRQSGGRIDPRPPPRKISRPTHESEEQS